MSYRVHEHPKHLARRTVEATTTPMRFWVNQQSTTELAFPCFYQEIRKPMPAVHHNVHWHHHVGWPVYNHPDHICQMMYTPNMCGHKGGCKSCRHYLDASSIFPIDLLAEGYTDFEVAFDFEDARRLFCGPEYNTPAFPYEGLWVAADAYVNETEPWVVRVLVDVHFGVNKMPRRPIRVPFAIRARASKTVGRAWDDKTKSYVEYTILPRYDTIGLGEIIILPEPNEESHNLPF